MTCTCFSSILSRKKNYQQPQQEIIGLSSDKNIKLFSYKELRLATDNFHPNTKIGRGGFGTVYKGKLRNGVTAALKVLAAQSKQGLKEFLTEIDIITNVRHPYLVELIGCCIEGSNRILVYEYLENNSLDHALLGSKSNPRKLDWSIRSTICLGTARGLAYLHEELEPPIVHRDIKASNILLDANYLPKIGDFGLAKLFPDNITHISTRVAGTTGYLAPEYALQGQLTKRADVYSFGVLVIEIISGRSSSKSYWSEVGNLLEWTWHLYESERLMELIDPTIGEYPLQEVLHFTKVALFCTQAAAGRRPSMMQVVEMLSNPGKLNEKELTLPGYSEGSTRMGKATKAIDSSSSHFKGSTLVASETPFTSSSITFSMAPRMKFSSGPSRAGPFRSQGHGYWLRSRP